MSGFIAHTKQKMLVMYAVVVFCLIVIDLPGFSAEDTSRNVVYKEIPDNRGKEFIIGFMQQFNKELDGAIRLFITSDYNTRAEVTILDNYFNSVIDVKARQLHSVDVANSMRMEGTKIENKGILIKADHEIVVYGLNIKKFTTDAFLALPVDIQSTNYIIPSFTPSQHSLLAVIGIYDSTLVFITFRFTNKKSSLKYKGRTYRHKDTLSIKLSRLQTFQIAHDSDMTGTRVVSNRPISVFSGNECANVPRPKGFCDHLVEHIPPTNTWGMQFVTAPLRGRTGGDFFRILAANDSTSVQINGRHKATLNEGRFLEVDVDSSQHQFIETSKPCLVIQFSKGSRVDDTLTDPFMIMIPPIEQYTAQYTVSTPDQSSQYFTSYINIIIETRHIDRLRLDGESLRNEKWVTVWGTEHSAAQIAVSHGVHRVMHDSPIVPFAIFLYGFSKFDSYGYPGGLRLADLTLECVVGKPGDGLDNDCDRRIDEELKNFIDDDNDGLIDEDLVTEPPQIQLNVLTSVLRGCPSEIKKQLKEPTVITAPLCSARGKFKLSFSDNSIEKNCVQYITRTWYVRDGCGNLANTSQDITIARPRIHVIFPGEVRGKCRQGNDLSVTGKPTVTTKCSEDVFSVRYQDRPNLKKCITDGLPIDREWTVKASCGSSIKRVQKLLPDDTAPKAFFVGRLMFLVKKDFRIRWNATEKSTFECALDDQSKLFDCGKGLTGGYRRNDLSNGKHTLWVRPTDLAGNVGEFIRHPFDVDNIGPRLQFVQPLKSQVRDSIRIRWRSPELARFKCGLDPARMELCGSGKQASRVLRNLRDGIHTFYVGAQDENRNEADLIKHTFRVDNQPPRVTLDKPPPKTSTSSTWPFKWKSNEMAYFQCALDNTTKLVPCGSGTTGQWTTPTLSNGKHVFYVLAKDELGNRAPAVRHRWTVDTEPPKLQFTGKLPSSEKVKRQIFRWKSSERSNFLCSIDSTTEYRRCPHSPNGVLGRWISRVLDDGPHTFRVKGVDGVGNEGPVLEHRWTIDTEPPAVTLHDIPKLSKSRRLNITWDASEPSTFVCTLDGEKHDCGSGTDGSFATPDLKDGQHLFTLQAKDKVGNRAPLLQRRFTTDTSVPVLKFFGNLPTSEKKKKQNFKWSSTESATFLCSIDSPTNYSRCTDDSGTQGRWDSNVLDDGPHTFRVKGVDKNGNEGPVLKHSWMIDTQPPAVTLGDVPSVSTSPRVGLKWDASEPSTYECTLDGKQYDCGKGENGSFTTPDLDDGQHLFTLQAKDLVGNKAPLVKARFTTDSKGPVITFNQPDPRDPQANVRVGWTSSENAVFECALDDPNDFKRCGKGTKGVFEKNNLPDGAHKLYVRGRDKADNVGKPTVFTVTTDNTAPTLQFVDKVKPLTKNPIEQFKWISSEDANFICQVDNEPETNCGRGKTGTFSTPYYPAGQHIFRLTPVDKVGNRGQALERDWTVDTTPPKVHYFDQPPKASGDEVTFKWHSSEEASFDCALDDVKNAVPCGSGRGGVKKLTSVPKGNHVFWVRGTDKAGNIGAFVPHDWAVDTRPPSIRFTGDLPSFSKSSLSLNWRSDEDSVFECALVVHSPGVLNIDYKPCGNGTEGNWRNDALPEQKVTFYVRAKDKLNNVGKPISHSWVVDTTPPRAILDPVPSKTSNPRMTLSWTANENARFFCAISDVGNQIECGEGTSGGLTTPRLRPGPHQFWLIAEDHTGNRADPVTVRWQVDSKAPTVKFTKDSTTKSKGSPKFSWTSDESASFDCAIEGVTQFEQCGSGTNGTWSRSNVPDGKHKFLVRARDKLGNEFPHPFRFPFEIDSTPPTGFTVEGPSRKTKEPQATFKWRTSEDAQYECYLDDQIVPTDCGEGRKGNSSTPLLPDGDHKFRVIATDDTGNKAPVVNHLWTIDTVGPVVTFDRDQPTSTLKSPRFTFTSNEPARFKCALNDQVNWLPCGGGLRDRGTYQGVNIPNGDHSLHVKGTDALGNTGEPALHRFTVDNEAPTLTLTSKPKRNSSSPTFEWVSSENVRFECSLDHAPFSHCGQGKTGSWTGRNVDDGPHKFSVQGKDINGNTGRHTYTWNIDSTPPKARLIGDVPTQSNQRRLIFTWQSDENAKFTCHIEGLKKAARDKRCGFGKFGQFPTPLLPDGTYTFVLTPEDLSGNKGPTIRHTWRSDSNGPKITFPPNTPKVTKKNPTFTWDSSESAKFKCGILDESQNLVDCGEGTNGKWTGDNLSDGIYAFLVQGEDDVGNRGGKQHIFTVDNNSPIITFPNPRTTTRPNTVLTWQSSEDAFFECSMDGADFTPCGRRNRLAQRGSYPAKDLSHGQHVFRVRGKDKNGNVGEPTSHNWNVDAKPPAVRIKEPFPTRTFNPSIGVEWTSDEHADFRCALDNPANQVWCGSGTRGRWRTPIATDGEHTIYITAEDLFKNTGPSVTRKWTLDTRPPVLNVRIDPLTQDSASPKFTWTSTEDATFECAIDDTRLYEDCGNGTSGTFTANSVPNGKHAFYIRAKDDVGNYGDHNEVQFGVDTLAPVVDLVSSVSSKSRVPLAVFRWRANEPSKFECKLDGKVIDCVKGLKTSGEYRTPKLPDGDHTFSLTTVDDVGNKGIPSVINWNIDSSPPEIEVNSDHALHNNSNPKFTWTSSEDSEFECAIDDTRLYQPCGKGTSGKFTANDVPSGRHMFYIRGKDSHDNYGRHVSFPFRVDTSPPRVYLQRIPSKTKKPRVTFNWRANEDSTFECVLNGKPIVCGTGTRGNYTTPNMPDGKHTFVLKTVDKLGNKGTPVKVEWEKDSSTPVIDFTSEVPKKTKGDLRVRWSSSEPAYFECAFDNLNNRGRCGGGKTGGWDGKNIPNGRHTFSVRGVDELGNTGDWKTFTFDVDRSGPVITFPNDLPRITKNNPTFNWKSSEPAKYKCGVDYSFNLVDCGNGTSGSWDGKDLPDGAHTFLVYGVDDLGNRGKLKEHRFVVDNSSPEITFFQTPDKSTSSPRIRWRSTENAKFECSLDGGNYDDCGNGLTGKWLGSNIPHGKHEFSVRGRDKNGNVGQPKKFTWDVDTKGPKVSIREPFQERTSNRRNIIEWTSNEDANFRCAVDNMQNAVRCGKGKIGRFVSPRMSDGEHTFFVIPEDPLGNTGPIISRKWTVDSEAPEVTVYHDKSNPQNNNPKFVWSSSEDGLYECAIDDQNSFKTCGRGTDGTFTANNVTDGRHTFFVRAKDDVGNTRIVPHAFHIDSTPPVIQFPSKLPTLTKGNPQVRWSSSEHANFECALDDFDNRILCGAGKNGRWYGVNIPKGPHTFYVRGTDKANNVGEWKPYKFTADTTGPQITLRENTPTVTSDNPTFQWQSSEEAKFKCGIDNIFALVNCNKGRNGQWTASNLPDGSHEFIVYGIDPLGNRGEYTRHQFTVDTQAPTISFSKVSPVTNPSADISWTSTEDTELFECSLDGGNYVNCGTGLKGNWSKNLPHGRHVFSVRGRDKNGNVGTPTSHTWHVDANPPNVQIQEPFPKVSTKPIIPIAWTSDEVAKYHCRVDNMTALPCGYGTKVYWATPSLPDGDHTFYLSSEDMHGNRAPLTTRKFTVDTNPPVLTFNAGLPTTSGKNPILQWTSDENATFECVLDDFDNVFDCGSGLQGSWAAKNLTDERHLFWVRGKDKNGNTGSYISHGWVVDDSAPRLAFLGVLPRRARNLPTFHWRSNELATFECSLDDERFSYCGKNITGKWSRIEVSSGSHVFRVRGRDTKGNIGEPISHDIIIDNTGPVIKLVDPLKSKTTEAIMVFRFTSNEHTTFKCSVDGLEDLSVCGEGENGLYETKPLRDGRHTFYLLGEDKLGNSAQMVTHRWNVEKTNADVAFLPDQPDVSPADVTLRWKTVSNVPASFECALDDDKNMKPCGFGRNGYWTGNDIPDGPHTFYVKAKDQFGDYGSVIQHKWTVDTRVPKVQLIGTPPKLSSYTTGSFMWTSDEPASFECAIDVVETSEACGSGKRRRWNTPNELPDGEHTFYLFATDENGNKADPVQYKWTIDSSPPVVTMDKTNPPISGRDVVIKWNSDEQAKFRCAVKSLFDIRKCGQGANGEIRLQNLRDGENTIWVKGRDSLGNTGEWKAHTWVVDSEPPQIAFTSKLPKKTNATAVFHWRTEEKSKFKCKLGNGPAFDCGEGFSSNFTGKNLTHGRKRFYVTATDTFGNDVTISHGWNVDTKPPALSFTRTLPDVTKKRIKIKWRSNKFAEFYCAHENVNDMEPCGNGTRGTWREDRLPDGKHRFWVGAIDKVGNQAKPLSHVWIVDTRGPVLHFNEPVPQKSGRSVRFAWRSNENAQFSCAFETQKRFFPCGKGFEADIRSENLKRNGKHRIFIKGVDEYGNVGDTISTTWIVDLIAPVLIETGPLPRLTNKNPIITWRVNEEAVFECALDDLNRFEWCGNGTTGKFRGRNLDKGKHQLVVRVKDKQGNSKPIINHTFVVGIPDNRGREFILGFMQQYNRQRKGSVSLFITSDNKTEAHISIPGIGFKKTVQLEEDQLGRVDLPTNVRMSGTSKESKGILVTANHELVIYGLNIMPHSTDAYLALPTDIQGMEYYAVSYTVSQNSLIAVVAIEDNTRVYLTLKMSIDIPIVYHGVVYRDGDSIEVKLDRLETFQLTHEVDLTGTRITSTKVVSVYSGNECANVPKDKGYCDHLVEMLTPTSTWGRRFVTAPLFSRRNGDFFRVVASEDNTAVVFHPGSKYVINAGEFVERDVPSDEYQFITATNPCILMQYSKGADADQTDTDPFLIMIPPIEQYGSHYILSTPDHKRQQYFQSYVNVIVLSKHIYGVLVDGEPVYHKNQFKEIKGTPYSAAAITVSTGAHHVDHTSPIVTFGAFMYGYAWRDSYGYPGGLRLADITGECTGVDTPADGMDNDCDRRIDEELMNGLDDDGDGRIDEDLATFPPDIQLSQTYYEYESCTLEVDALVPRAKAIGSYECELKGEIRLTFQDRVTELECARSINRTWRAADGCGNVVYLNQIIKIVRPKLTVTYPLHVPNGCNGAIDLKETGEPVVESLCKREQVILSYRDNISVNECQIKGLLLEREFTITEKCGREYRGIQRIYPGAVN